MTKKREATSSTTTSSKKIKQTKVRTDTIKIKRQKSITLETLALFSAEEKNDVVNCIIQVPDLVGMGTPEEFGFLMEKTEEGVYQMVLREELLPFLEQIDSASKPNTTIQNFGKALWGPGGVGKSSILFFLAQYCKQKGWVVFYLPSTAHVSSEFKVLNLLLNFKKKNETKLKELKLGARDLFSIVECLESNIDNVFQTAKTVIDALLTFTSQETPKAIIVDQWNVMLKIPDNEITKQMSCFNDMAVIERGIFFTALSSQAHSTLPSTAFRDASKNQYRFIIPSFSDDAFMSHIWIKTHKDSLTVKEFTELKRETGCIPRLLSYAFKNGKIDMQNFTSNAVSYYRDRVSSFLTREGLGKNTVNSIAFVAASIFLNKVVQGTVDASWTDSGLLVKIQDNSYEAPCPSAREAILQHIKSQSIDLISFLAQDNSTKERALELFFVSAFHEVSSHQPRSITLHPYSSKKENGKDIDIELCVSKVVHQPPPKKGVYELMDIDSGTLVVCHSGFSVIDFFLYSRDRYIFIQVSRETYAEHRSKLNPKLWTTKISTKKKELSIMNYFRLSAGAAKTTKQPCKKSILLYMTTREVKPNKIPKFVSILADIEQWKSFGVDYNLFKDIPSAIIEDQENADEEEEESDSEEEEEISR